MKNKILYWLSIISILPGTAWAADPDWITKNTQTFFYGMVGSGALAAVLIIWEIIYQISARKSSNTGAVMKVVTESTPPEEEEYDPIKALLTEQIRGGKPEEEALPSFLREDPSKDNSQSSGAETPGDDPFRRLLQKSTQKTEEAPKEDSQGARRMILPPIKPKSAEGAAESAGDGDPFKKLLVSSKEAKKPESPSSEDKPEILSDDSDMELLISNEPELVAPPADDKPKKLAFRMGTSAAKPTGAEKLFDRISDAKGSSDPSASDDGAPAPPRKLGIGIIRKTAAPAETPLEAPTPESSGDDDGAKPGKRLELKFKPRSK